jgi:tetratricopeptide (TPR) repeat protein
LRDLAKVYLSLGEIELTTNVRETMAAHLDPVDWRFVYLDWAMKLEQGKLEELPSALEALPVEVTDKWWARAWKANSYIRSGDLKKAREYWMMSEPDWDDPDQWQRLIGMNNHGEDRLNACNYAGILMAVGDEVQGRELLRQAIYHYENILPGLVQDPYLWPGLGWCRLVAGSFEEALGFYEQRVANGHISSWWKDEKLPWWGPIRNHPRYLALVNSIEEKLNDQRELLHITKSDSPLPARSGHHN